MTQNNIILPLPPSSSLEEKKANHHHDMEIYARFMRHLRMVPNNAMEIKILCAIQFTADMLDLNDSLVTKTLVEMGLRTPRRALPADYLRYVDHSLLRSGLSMGGPNGATMDLKAHWDCIGEDKFAPHRQAIDHATIDNFVES